MPSPTEFRKGLGLQPGRSVPGLGTVTACSTGHVVRQQNELYEFPTELTIQLDAAGKGQPRRLASTFKRQVNRGQIVYSAYGSPYECSVEGVKVKEAGEEQGSVTLTYTGKAARRRDIPTLAQRKAKERQQKGIQDDVAPEGRYLVGNACCRERLWLRLTTPTVFHADAKRYLQGYRVIKSRFGSSTCSVCNEPIDPGVKIAKQEGKAQAGGWAHVTCQLKQLKAQDRGGKKRGRRQEAADVRKPSKRKRVPQKDA